MPLIGTNAKTSHALHYRYDGFHTFAGEFYLAEGWGEEDVVLLTEKLASL